MPAPPTLSLRSDGDIFNMMGKMFAPPAPVKKQNKCVIKKEDQLNDMEMMRQLYYAMYNGMVKGLFHD